MWKETDWKKRSGDGEMETVWTIFRRKLSSGISVVSYKKLESNFCVHTRNNEPHSSGLSEVSAVCISSCEPESGAPKLKEELENSKDSPQAGTDLGDFIPLPSPENSDCEMESFEPHLPLTLPSGAFSSPSKDDCQLKKGTQDSLQCMGRKNLNLSNNKAIQLPIKSLYSDVEGEKKSSVFSRLNFGSKDIRQENRERFREKARGYNSVQDIMLMLLQRRGSWGKNCADDKTFGRRDVTPTMKRSVFSHLSRIPESTEEENVSTIWLHKDFYKGNKRVRRARFSSHGRKDAYKWSGTVEQWPEASEQNGCWTKTTEREVSYQNLGDEENFVKSSYMGKVLKRHRQTEESFDEGSRNKCKLEKPPRRKLVRPLFEMPSEVKTITSDNYANQMPSEESSADKEKSGSCKAPIKDDTADERISTSVRKEMQPVLGPLQCKGVSGEAESDDIDEVSTSGELLVGRLKACCDTTAIPLKVYKRHAKKFVAYSISVV